MSNDDFQTYFHQRARRFSSFYSSESVSRMLGRGPLFDRLRMAVDMAVAAGAKSVLDVGCGSGPLFSTLAEKGIHVTGIDPADYMVALARAEAAKYPGLATVEQRSWADIDEVDAYDVAVALGVYGYPVDGYDDLAKRAGMQVLEKVPLGKAGFVVRFGRIPA